MKNETMNRVKTLLAGMPIDNKIKIKTINGGLIQFTGRYRPDLEATNWHYWEKADKTIIHIKKSELVSVEGGTEMDMLISNEIKEIIKKERLLEGKNY